MKIILAKSAGFCRGVRLAVKKARSMALTQTPSNNTNKSKEQKIYTDGPLIHNSQMLETLRAEGIVECDNVMTTTEGVLLIRAHGIPPERRKILTALPLAIVDATCPDVARIQGTIRKYARIGYHIVIFGDAGHPEVTGLLGFAESKGHLVTKPTDVDSLPDLHPYCLVAQSTQFTTAFNEIANVVSHRFPDSLIIDTICPATKERQKELLAMTQTVDAIVVIGDKTSANTMRLVELAKTYKPTFHIQTADQLNKNDFIEYNTVGLTAGASTPDFVINNVEKHLANMFD